MEKIPDSLVRIADEMNANNGNWSREQLLTWSGELFNIAIELTRIMGTLDGTKIVVERKA